jgi:outer membrane protein OmpA-like peptidoglycan-associated protein
MKTSHFAPALLTIATLVGACSSMPKTTSLLDQTRLDYTAAQNNPKVASFAPLELKRASEAMDHANAAAGSRDSDEKVDKLAYLARQQIALTQEVAKQKSAEAEVANASKERDQVRLEQRTREADQAKVSAEQSRLSAQLSQNDAADAQRKTQDAQARTAQLEAQLADLSAKQTERGMVITLGDVLFGTDQSNLNQNGMNTARKLADVLRQNPQRTVLIEGFTDSTGAAAHNQELSERRAISVRSALQEMGVARERIDIRGYGQTYPVAANDTAQNRQLNRRVEIVFSDASGKVMQR